MVITQHVPFEICRKSLSINRNEEFFCEWCNWHFAVRTGKGIHFYEFSHNLECLDKRLDCMETFVQTPTNSPTTGIFDCNLVRDGLKNRDISEMMMDTAMWSHSEYLVNEMTNVLAFEFSPVGLIRENTCALAILNNIGNVELFTAGRCKWVSILDMSPYIQDHFKEMLKCEPTNFRDLKKTAYNLTSCSICWAPNMKNGTSYFVMCQKSGVLLFWSVQNHGEEIIAKFCGTLELALDEIVHLKWIPRLDNKFLLICSSVSGTVLALECQNNMEKVVLIDSHMLWEQKDRMIAKFSEYFVDGSRILLFYNKHRHLVSQLIDDHCRIISQTTLNVNDYRLTSIVKCNAEYYVTTINFKLYRINYIIDSNVLNITMNAIDIKDIAPSMELSSVRFSVNGVICALTGLDRRILHKKEPLLLDTIFLQAVSDSAILELLFNNPTKKLTNYWDCIELIRFKIVKLKTLPQLNFHVLLAEGETDVYKLKIYLIILRIYRSLVNNIKLPDGRLPENSIELIKDKILALHANANIETIYNKHISGRSINDFEKECFVGSKKYLKLYNEKYKINLTDRATLEKWNFIVTEYNYTCQCCDKPIKSFSCEEDHRNMFCLVTFMPIESFEYLTCKYCNTTARAELLPEKPLCVFCDSYLEIQNFCE